MTKGFNNNDIAIKAFKHGQGVEALCIRVFSF